MSLADSVAAQVGGLIALLMICALCAALVYVSIDKDCSRVPVLQHAAVAIALVPLSFVFANVVVVTYNGLGDTLRTFAKENAKELPWPLVYAIAAVRPLVAQTGLTETMWMACLLFTAYAVTRVWHHLIDILRLLKASRRRLLLPEMRELRRQEEAQQAKAQKRR